MSTHQRSQYNQGYCLCQTNVCVLTQQQLGRYRGRIPPRVRVNVEWYHPATPVAVHFHPVRSNYTTWLLVLSMCYHIPAFLETFLKDVGDLPLPHWGQQHPIKKAKWLINRIHFPATLLLHRRQKTYGLTHNAKLLSPGIAKALETLDSASVLAGEGRIPMTTTENTVGFLEQYAEQVLPDNLYQQFLQSKIRTKPEKRPPDFFVQAPGVSSAEVLRFCRALNLLPDAIINIVPRQQLVVVAVPPKASPPQILATMQSGNDGKTDDC